MPPDLTKALMISKCVLQPVRGSCVTALGGAQTSPTVEDFLNSNQQRMVGDPDVSHAWCSCPSAPATPATFFCHQSCTLYFSLDFLSPLLSLFFYVHFCRSVLGIIKRDGALARFVCAPISNLHLVPDSLSDQQACFAEPLAAACRILEQGLPAQGTKVAVLGESRSGPC